MPNEIFLCIFKQIAPPTEHLTPEQLRIFTNLSLASRFFANLCLPRIFEFVEFSGAIFRDVESGLCLPLNNDIYKTSPETPCQDSESLPFQGLGARGHTPMGSLTSTSLGCYT